MTSALRKLIIVSKSRWMPAIRREHALAGLAAEHGYRVSFIEAPADVRALRETPRSWLSGFGRGSLYQPSANITVTARSCIMPPHRNAGAEAADQLQLRWLLSGELSDGPAAVVVTLPWHVRAVPQRADARLILDVADDWAALLPARAEHIADLYRFAERRVDELVLVSESLQSIFAEQEAHVIRNGVHAEILDAEPSANPVPGRLVYVGTLSERFDAHLVGELLERLPEHTVDLYGPCAYAGRGSEPGPELVSLLERADNRVSWHGAVSRTVAASVMDAAEALLMPNSGNRSRGQDSMKIYDYAARGRPILAAAASVQGTFEMPPHTYVADSAQELARLVAQARIEPAHFREARRAWASEQTWESRWPAWEQVLFGSPVPVSGVCATEPSLGSSLTSGGYQPSASFSAELSAQALSDPDAGGFIERRS